VVNTISRPTHVLISDYFFVPFQDHALELQALKFTMDQSGACRAIDAIIKAGGQTDPSPATQKQTLLSAMFDQINGQGNAFSLDSGVNGAVSELMRWSVLVLGPYIRG
jgi:hypothetical protein